MIKIHSAFLVLALFLGDCAGADRSNQDYGRGQGVRQETRAQGWGKIKSGLNRNEQAGQASKAKKVKIKITPSPFLNEKRGLQGDFRRVDTVHIGDMAPDFKLKTMDGKRTVKLGQFNGKRPVVLIFGSYT